MKLSNFVSELSSTLESIRPMWYAEDFTGRIKASVGDSLNNNRVPSVNQVIRFLTREESSTRQYKVGRILKNVYGLTRSELRTQRLNDRTDAYDINEFIRNVGSVVKAERLSKKVNSLIA